LKLFGSARSYGAFALRKDFSFGLADVPDREFTRILEAVLKAVHELVASGAVREAQMIIFPSVPLPFIRHAPLIEGEWIDHHIVELAEFGAAPGDHGFEIIENGDRHLLAWPEISAPSPSASDAMAIRDQVTTKFSNFGGRSRLFDGRPYLNLSDYKNWPERKLKGDLRREEGFLIESFNRWAEQSEACSELAAVIVEPIHPRLSESDIVVYPEVEAAAEAQECRREIVDELAARDTDEDPVLRWRKLFQGFAAEILNAQALVEFVQKRYFWGQEILSKSSANQLKTALHIIDELAIGFDNQIALRSVPYPSGFSPQGEIEAIKRSINSMATAKSLVNLCKADANRFIGRPKAAFDLLIADLREVADR
jgi:hypothetical protein